MMRLKHSRRVLLVVTAIAALNGAYVAASERDDVGYLATGPKFTKIPW